MGIYELCGVKKFYIQEYLPMLSGVAAESIGIPGTLPVSRISQGPVHRWIISAQNGDFGIAGSTPLRDKSHGAWHGCTVDLPFAFSILGHFNLIACLDIIGIDTRHDLLGPVAVDAAIVMPGIPHQSPEALTTAIDS